MRTCGVGRGATKACVRARAGAGRLQGDCREVGDEKRGAAAPCTQYKDDKVSSRYSVRFPLVISPQRAGQRHIPLSRPDDKVSSRYSVRFPLVDLSSACRATPHPPTPPGAYPPLTHSVGRAPCACTANANSTTLSLSESGGPSEQSVIRPPNLCTKRGPHRGDRRCVLARSTWAGGGAGHAWAARVHACGRTVPWQNIKLRLGMARLLARPGVTDHLGRCGSPLNAPQASAARTAQTEAAGRLHDGDMAVMRLLGGRTGEGARAWQREWPTVQPSHADSDAWHLHGLSYPARLCWAAGTDLWQKRGVMSASDANGAGRRRRGRRVRGCGVGV